MENGHAFEPVGFWPRVWAAFVDALVFFLFNVSLLYAIHGATYSKSDIPVRGPVDLLNWFVLPNVELLLFWLVSAATPGKMAISAKIVDAKTGRAPRPHQLLLRLLGYYLSALPLGLGFLWVAFGSRRQGWHDMLAGTAVIRA